MCYLSTTEYTTSANSTATVSSELTAAPASNAYDNKLRSRVWRSAGQWVVAADTKLVFRETTAVDLTATLSTDTHVTTAAFLADIKTQMETVGASTYTVELDATTNKIKITSDGGGGGGIFEMILTDGDSTTFGNMTGFGTSDLTGALTYTAATLKIHTSEHIIWDMGAATNPKFFALIGRRNESIQLSDSATIKIQGNTTNNFSSPAYTDTLAYDATAVVSVDITGLHSGGLRYWRLYIEDTSNPAGYIEISHCIFSDLFLPATGAIQFPLIGTRVDYSKNVTSESGVIYSLLRPKTEKLNVNWYGMTVADKENHDEVFDLHGTADSFYWVLDPALAYSSALSKYTRLGRYTGFPAYKLELPGIFSAQAVMVEEI